MFLKLKSLLNAAETGRLVTLNHELNFVDGRLTNQANSTKNNLQADVTDPRYLESTQIVEKALLRTPEFVEFSFPKRIWPPLLTRYEPNMKYGAHSDSAMIGDVGSAMRRDLSGTVFLNDPASYEGGELVIHIGDDLVAIKGQPGSAVFYPSTTIHEVRPVLSGTRMVSIIFVESLVADEHQRTQLYELGEVLALEGLKMNWQNRTRLTAVQQNLLRMWSR